MSLAPAVSKDGFSFAGDLFVEASGNNRHRRATVAELKDHFKSGSEKDHPAHWFEAQLIHYGLQPSKTKAVARMRLYDAVNGGKLSVPAHITKLETELKKEWTKKEREAKKAKKAKKEPTFLLAPKATKRKAESSNVDVTLNFGGVNITVSTGASNSSSNQPAAKKAKTTKSTESTPKAAKKQPKPEPKPKTPKTSTPKTSTPRATPSSTTKTKAKQDKKPSTAPSSSAELATTASSTPKRSMASRRGISQGTRRGGATSASSSAPVSTASPRPGMGSTARRSGASVAPGRIPASGSGGSPMSIDDGGYDEPPPPYAEYDNNDDGWSNDDFGGYHPAELIPVGFPSAQFAPLGLLNGRYDIRCPDVTEEFGYRDFSLVLTLSGSELWGQFNLGVVFGILHFEERPYRSLESLDFTWRGRDEEGRVIYGDDNGGSIQFLGDGRIEGQLDFIEFQGQRLAGQGTRSEVHARTMESEWDGYNEDGYECGYPGHWHIRDSP
ncbi:hypothetical protein AAE478_005581 [Parahypoxylon ruwenzoriense]